MNKNQKISLLFLLFFKVFDSTAFAASSNPDFAGEAELARVDAPSKPLIDHITPSTHPAAPKDEVKRKRVEQDFPNKRRRPVFQEDIPGEKRKRSSRKADLPQAQVDKDLPAADQSVPDALALHADPIASTEHADRCVPPSVSLAVAHALPADYHSIPAVAHASAAPLIDVTYYDCRDEFFATTFSGLNSPKKILEFTTGSLSGLVRRMTKNPTTGGFIAYIADYKAANDIEIRVEDKFICTPNSRRAGRTVSHKFHTTTLNGLKCLQHRYIYFFPTCAPGPLKKRVQDEAFAVLRFSYSRKKPAQSMMEVLYIRALPLGVGRISGNDIMRDWCIPLFKQLQPTAVILHDDAKRADLIRSGNKFIRFRLLFALMGQPTFYEKYDFHPAPISLRKVPGRSDPHIQMPVIYEEARRFLRKVPLGLIIEIYKKIDPDDSRQHRAQLLSIITKYTPAFIEGDAWLEIPSSKLLSAFYKKMRAHDQDEPGSNFKACLVELYRIVAYDVYMGISAKLVEWNQSKKIKPADLESGRVGFRNSELSYFLALDVITDYHLWSYSPGYVPVKFDIPGSEEPFGPHTVAQKVLLLLKNDKLALTFSCFDKDRAAFAERTLVRAKKRKVPFISAKELAFCLLADKPPVAREQCRDFVDRIK